MKYSVPFRDTKERDRIRKWAGMTSGATILKKSGDWSIKGGDAFGGFTVTETYIVEVTTKKAEMLLKLQFAEAKKYFEQDGVFDDVWYVFKPRRP